MPKNSSSIKLNRTTTLAVTLGGLILAILFIFTGADPLGLFSDGGSNQSVPQSSGSGGDWWQVYFTDPNTINDPENLSGSIPEKLIAYIDSAERSIHIAAFEFNLTPVAEALIRAHQRGVQVRLVVERDAGDRPEIQELIAAGIPTVLDEGESLMHNKFFIIDGAEVWTGSMNLTVNGAYRHLNNLVRVRSTRLAENFMIEFEEMFLEGYFGEEILENTPYPSLTRSSFGRNLSEAELMQ